MSDGDAKGGGVGALVEGDAKVPIEGDAKEGGGGALNEGTAESTEASPRESSAGGGDAPKKVVDQDHDDDGAGNSKLRGVLKR